METPPTGPTWTWTQHLQPPLCPHGSLGLLHNWAIKPEEFNVFIVAHHSGTRPWRHSDQCAVYLKWTSLAKIKNVCSSRKWRFWDIKYGMHQLSLSQLSWIIRTVQLFRNARKIFFFLNQLVLKGEIEALGVYVGCEWLFVCLSMGPAKKWPPVQGVTLLSLIDWELRDA